MAVDVAEAGRRHRPLDGLGAKPPVTEHDAEGQIGSEPRALE
jgi:hypothetical protein